MAEPYPEGYDPVLIDVGGETLGVNSGTGTPWSPILRQDCTFPPEIFLRVMGNFIKNPNINTSWLFRADIIQSQEEPPFHHVQNSPSSEEETPDATKPPFLAGPSLAHLPVFSGYTLTKMVVRRLIPRNTLRDDPMDQTCLWYTSSLPDRTTDTLIVYIPHGTADTLPFYHPNIRGLAHLHNWNPATATGTISVHYLYFSPSDSSDPKLHRTALRLLSELHKHGKGQAAGYQKRVRHDTIIPQDRVQNRYTTLKQKYARQLIMIWAEKTDPTKHVFEDLAIAAFLIELWVDMYTAKGLPFLGFVDIGCGNGLLVYLLRNEGYPGWGFDARSRTSWQIYQYPLPPTNQPAPLQTKILLPSLVTSTTATLPSSSSSSSSSSSLPSSLFHNGQFLPGTFILSNHADELTPWTPLLAALSHSPFLSIPCCSHNLAGDKFRAPPPRDRTKGQSAYASLVDWVAQIGEAAGWKVEVEMLRIPSTRNTGLIGRERTREVGEEELIELVNKFGGCAGYLENVQQLLKGGMRGH